ncbi:hypothetical protein C7B61_12105, partial [filamentous cyanobacterium CCP1]
MLISRTCLASALISFTKTSRSEKLQFRTQRKGCRVKFLFRFLMFINGIHLLDCEVNFSPKLLMKFFKFLMRLEAALV